MEEEKLNNKEEELFRKDTYKKVLPIRLYNYWLNKLFSEKPNFVALEQNGTANKEAIQRAFDIMERSNFRDVVAKYLGKKSKGEGYGAITLHLVDDYKGGKIPLFRVAEGVVKYNSFLETDQQVQVIENLNRGIVPLIRVKTYGTKIDTLSYELGDNFNIDNYDGDDKEDIKRLLNKTKKIVHNLGFVRALVFRNRVDDEHYDYGQNDLNGYEDLITNIDITNNRMLNEIDKNSTHISRTLSTGSILNPSGSFGEAFTNQEGMIKETFRTIDTEEGVDSVVIQGDITLGNLLETIQAKVAELDQITGIQIGYDAMGKTNDTNSKVDKIGDPAHKEATLRKEVETTFWSKVFLLLSKLDPKKEIWEKIERIEFVPRLNDFRNKAMMMENIDKIAKYYPLKDMYVEMLDVSANIAEQMVDAKEEEIKQKIVSALPVLNGNLPQNVQVDFGWGETVEKQPNEGEEDTQQDKE